MRRSILVGIVVALVLAVIAQFAPSFAPGTALVLFVEKFLVGALSAAAVYIAED